MQHYFNRQPDIVLHISRATTYLNVCSSRTMSGLRVAAARRTGTGGDAFTTQPAVDSTTGSAATARRIGRRSTGTNCRRGSSSTTHSRRVLWRWTATAPTNQRTECETLFRERDGDGLASLVSSHI